jgi:glycosyltransferase involved in cell wall biosynthesis
VIGNHRCNRPIAVSVIVTLYNYEGYIGKCIRSALEQTFPHLELIVVNDCSLDGSLEVARELLSAELPITIVDRKRNTGVAHPRNLGIELSRGEHVFILDADNYLLPECIEEHVSAMGGTDCVAAYAIVECIDDGGAPLHTMSDRAFDPTVLRKENYVDAMALFDRRSLMHLGCYDTGLLHYGPEYEDWELWLRIGSSGGAVRFIESVLSRYRVKNNSLNALVVALFHDAIVEHLQQKYDRDPSVAT